MGSNLSFWSFWWETVKSSIKTAQGIISAFMFFITIALSITSSQNPEWGDWLNILAWALPLGIFLLLFIPSVMIQSHFLYKQKANEIDELTKEEIDLVVVTNDKQYLRTRTNEVHLIGRVGIKALGIRTIENVGVTLISIDENPNQYRDSYLNPSECNLGQPPTFNIDPGDISKFVEVFSWNPHMPNEPIGIHYYYNYQWVAQHGGNPASNPLAIFTPLNLKETKMHILKLQATGKDISPVTKNFIIDIKETGLIWQEEPSLNQS